MVFNEYLWIAPQGEGVLQTKALIVRYGHEVAEMACSVDSSDLVTIRDARF